MKLFFFPLILSFFCCAQKTTKDNCAQINVRAVDALNRYMNNEYDTAQLLVSLEFYDKAIACDSLNILNYQGKLTVMNILGRKEESLKILDKLVELNNEKFASLFVTKALIFEKLNQKDSSEVYFQRAFLDYDDQLALKPPDSLRIICNRLYLVAITENKYVAIKKLRKLSDKYPNDSIIKVYEEVLMNFDRNTILPK